MEKLLNELMKLKRGEIAQAVKHIYRSIDLNEARKRMKGKDLKFYRKIVALSLGTAGFNGGEGE